MASEAKFSAFSMQGELIHAFISYRAATEGQGEGRNGWASRIHDSLHSRDYQLPFYGRGIFPKRLAAPNSQNPNLNKDLKVFLDKEGLKMGQNFQEDFVYALERTMVYVPLLSWHVSGEGTEAEKHAGSVGQMHQRCLDRNNQVDEKARRKATESEDNVLLEMILALELLKHKGSGLKRIIPVFVNAQVDPLKLEKEISNAQDEKTNKLALDTLTKMGIPRHQLNEDDWTPRQVVEELSKFNGFFLFKRPELTEEQRVDLLVETVWQIIKDQIDVQYSLEFQHGSPQGAEVLAWLQENGLHHLSSSFASHGLTSLRLVYGLSDYGQGQLLEEHKERQQLSKVELGDSQALSQAIARLATDERALPLDDRLDRFTDTSVSVTTAMVTRDGVQILIARPVGQVVVFLMAVLLSGFGIYIVQDGAYFHLQYIDTTDGRQYTAVRLQHVASGTGFIQFILGLGLAFYLSCLPKPYLAYRTFAISMGIWIAFYMIGFPFGAIQSFIVGGTVQLDLWEDGLYENLVILICWLLLWMTLMFRQQYFFVLLSIICVFGCAATACVAALQMTRATEQEDLHRIYEVIFVGFAVVVLIPISAACALILRYRKTVKDAEQRVSKDREEYQKRWDQVTATTTTAANVNAVHPINQEPKKELLDLSRGIAKKLSDARKKEEGQMQTAHENSQGFEFLWSPVIEHLWIPVWSPMIECLWSTGQKHSDFYRSKGKRMQKEKSLDRLFAQGLMINFLFQSAMEEMINPPSKSETEYSTQSLCGHGADSSGKDGEGLTGPEDDVNVATSRKMQIGTFSGQGEQYSSKHFEPAKSKGKVSEILDNNTERFTVNRGPVKHPQRAIQKVIRSYHRETRLLTDIVRCTIAVETIEEVHKILQKVVESTEIYQARGNDEDKTPLLQESDKKMRITAIKNRFDDAGYDANASTGYRDLNLNLEVGWIVQNGRPILLPLSEWDKSEINTHICEVQVQLKGMMQQEGHQRYIEWRDLKAC